MERNKENQYREFNISTMYEIIDIMTYRTLRMPIEDIRKAETKDADFLRLTLVQKEKELDDQITQLLKIKEHVKRKQEHFKEYDALLLNPYPIQKPDPILLVPFQFQKKNHWDMCMNDSCHFSLFFMPSSFSPLYGLSLTKEEASTFPEDSTAPLWDLTSSENEYLLCLLKVSYTDHERHNLAVHHDYIRSHLKKTPGVTIARLLFTAYESERCDYYKAYIELI